jgi:hypothetical protein
LTPKEPLGSSEQPVEAPVWVRKRDGAVVAFDHAKLSSSLLAARRAVSERDAAFHAQELTQAVLHFLADEFSGQAPTTDEIAETVSKVLREMGQGPTARQYSDFRSRRQRLRQDLRVVDERGPLALAARDQAPSNWDKARLTESLIDSGDLEPALAREISAAVERRLLACQFHQVSQRLLDELVDAELLERGLERPRTRRRELSVPVGRLESMLSRGIEAEEACRLAGREMLSQYALRELYSPDVAGLHEEGLIHLFGAAGPTQWSALAATPLELAGYSGDFDSFLSGVESLIEQMGKKAEGVLSIDGVECLAALAVEPNADLAERSLLLAGAVDRGLRRCRAKLLLHLDGRIRSSVAVDLGDGPLFGVRLDEARDRAASQIASRLADLVLEDPDLSDRCIIDFHPDLSQDDGDLELVLRPWVRRARRHANLRIVFDREHRSLGEGFGRPEGGRASVCQAVGVVLPALLSRLGKGVDEETLVERIGLLCQACVRAGVQKREYLRRRPPDRRPARPEPSDAIVVVPIGLDALVTEMLGQSIASSETSTAFAVQILQGMSQRLRRESRHYRLPCRIDGLASTPDEWPIGDQWSLGATPALGAAGPRRQLLAAGRLHAAIGAGTVRCRLPEGVDAQDGEDPSGLLVYAARQTQIVRLGFSTAPAARQAALAQEWLG